MKKYIKVGYVKFASKKSREEIERDNMKIIVSDEKKNPVNSKSNMWLFSRENGAEYPVIIIYSTDKYFLDYDFALRLKLFEVCLFSVRNHYQTFQPS